MLILLTTGQRAEALSKLDLCQMIVYDDKLEFSVDQLKQSRPGYRNPLVILYKYPTDKSICVM